MCIRDRPDSVGDLLLRALPRLGACGVAAPPAGRLTEYAALLTEDDAAVVGLPGQLDVYKRQVSAG